MKNLITAAEGEAISFSLYHEVDEEQYTLKADELYRLKVKRSLNDSEPVCIVNSNDGRFDFADRKLTPGEYYFEISLVSGSDVVDIISPATDANGNKNNVLRITERL